MIKLFLAPTDFYNLDDGSFEDQCSYSYAKNREDVFGIPIELPALPRVGDVILIESIPENDLFSLVWTAYKNNNMVVDTIVEYFRKECKDLSDEDIIRDLCKSKCPVTGHSFYDGWWIVESIDWIANHDTVFVYVKHDL